MTQDGGELNNRLRPCYFRDNVTPVFDRIISATTWYDVTEMTVPVDDYACCEVSVVEGEE